MAKRKKVAASEAAQAQAEKLKDLAHQITCRFEKPPEPPLPPVDAITFKPRELAYLDALLSRELSAVGGNATRAMRAAHSRIRTAMTAWWDKAEGTVSFTWTVAGTPTVSSTETTR